MINGGGFWDFVRNSGYVIIGGASFRAGVEEVEGAGEGEGELVVCL